MRIGIDIDDTLAQTTKYITPFALKYAKENLGYELKLNPLEYFARNLSWKTKEDLYAFCKNLFQFEAINTPTLPQTKEILKKIKNDGHTIVIITARDNIFFDDPHEATKNWLDKNNIPYDILHTSTKYKGPVANEENIDVFIDNSYEQCSYIAEHYDIKVLIMDTLDRNISHSNITTVTSWKEAYEIIKEINK